MCTLMMSRTVNTSSVSLLSPIVDPGAGVTHPEPDHTQPSCQDTNVDLCLASELLAEKYQVLDELGSGGMGVVYLVRELVGKRRVVVKMLRSGCFCDDREREQFRREIETVSRLQHPGVIQVRDHGEVDGCPYYSMDHIDGPSLSQRLRQGPLASRDAARLLLKIAQAVQHAHEQGIVHRDLKPANILLDAQSKPHVIDFGLAREIDELAERDDGAIIGTPLYMAPEQAMGRTERMGPAADIYSLGAILYEMLTGRPPFEGGSLLMILRQVLEESPTPPTQLNPQVSAVLEAICLRCLEKDPSQRYPSAEALADDLMRYLYGQPTTVATVNRQRTRSKLASRRFPELTYLWEVLLLVVLAVLCHFFPGESVLGKLLLATMMSVVLLALGQRQRLIKPLPS